MGRVQYGIWPKCIKTVVDAAFGVMYQNTRLNVVSDTEIKEIKLGVTLPFSGFTKSMYFNRFCVVREPGCSLVHFGFVSASALVDSFSCILSQEALKENKQSILSYLSRIGHPAEASPPAWSGAGVEKRTQVVDIITMVMREEEAETCLFFISRNSANRMVSAGPPSGTISAQPVALLRSTADMQKQFIIRLYEEEGKT